MGCRLGALGVDMFGTKACSKGVPHKHSEHIAYKYGLRGSLNFDMDLRLGAFWVNIVWSGACSQRGFPEKVFQKGAKLMLCQSVARKLFGEIVCEGMLGSLLFRNYSIYLVEPNAPQFNLVGKLFNLVGK